MASLEECFSIVAEKLLLINKWEMMSLRMGYGKSLIFQALPLMSPQGSIAAVVSPLLNLSKHQVGYMNNLGIAAVSISEIETEAEHREVEQGKFSLVYGTTESWLDDRWIAFRECYSRLHELLSLAPKVKIVALTATATTSTRDTIFNVLLMKSPYIVSEGPNKGNITYSVHYMERDMDVEHYFGWLAEELRANKEECDRTIVHCQTEWADVCNTLRNAW